MQPGIIETIKAEELDEKKEFWNDRLAEMGLDRLYVARAHWINVPIRRLCIFIEKRDVPLPAASDGANEDRLS